MAPDTPTVLAFFGHHKCATGWIDNILMEVCMTMGIDFRMVHLPEHYQEYGSVSEFVYSEAVDFVASTNASADHLDGFESLRAFHVIRDPRDVVVSAYFSHLKSLKADSWDTLQKLRRDLESVSKDEGLIYEMDYLAPQFEDMAGWPYGRADVLELKLEALSSDPVAGFHGIMRHLGVLDDRASGSHALQRLRHRLNRLNHKGRRFMPANLPMFPVPRTRLDTILPDVLDGVLDKKSYRRLSGGRQKGQEDTGSHYRKGTPGDWRNHFTPRHKAYFKERFPGLLETLGYAAGDDW